MKKHSMFLLLATFIAVAMAQNKVCQIVGTTTDSVTNSLLLFEDGKDARVADNVTVIPVLDGKFSYDLPCDTLRYYELVSAEQFFGGPF